MDTLHLCPTPSAYNIQWPSHINRPIDTSRLTCSRLPTGGERLTAVGTYNWNSRKTLWGVWHRNRIPLNVAQLDALFVSCIFIIIRNKKSITNNNYYITCDIGQFFIPYFYIWIKKWIGSTTCFASVSELDHVAPLLRLFCLLYYITMCNYITMQTFMFRITTINGSTSKHYSLHSDHSDVVSMCMFTEVLIHARK